MKWSETYFGGLLSHQHAINNMWFQQQLSMLSDKGRLYVPTLNKTFNKQGDEL